MSFLDNLENNLKALEGREESAGDNRARRDAERNEARAAAPWAEKLKTAVWTKTLMTQATRLGFQRRLKVNLIWVETTLRLEARGFRLELRPTAKGVRCVFLKDGALLYEEISKLEGDPLPLLEEWMKPIDDEITSMKSLDLEEIES